MKWLHEDSLPEAIRAGGDFPQNAKDWMIYVRSATALKTTHPNFIENTVLAKFAFKEWWEAWLLGKQETLPSWEANLRTRHRLAAGEITQTPYFYAKGGYSSSGIDAGSFRDELVSSPVGHTSVQAASHIQAWLQAHGESPIAHRPIEIREFIALAKERNSYANYNFLHSAFPSTTYYAAHSDVPIIRELAWRRLNEIKDIVVSLKRADELSVRRDSILNPLADYFHTCMYGHFFFKINFSLLMGEVNTILEEVGYRPIRHGRIDFVSIRMDYLPFRRYFREYLAHVYAETASIP
jgi:hypothetical protein